MRFKNGSKVEVLCKKDMSLGAWRCAEIISGNEHNYSVRYDSITGTVDEKTVDKVPVTAIRPCPPLVGSAVNWASGDIAEVLDAGSWKAAIILNVLDGDSCLIRLLGSFTEFKIQKSKIRPRRTWQDDKWVVFGKAYGSHEASKSNNMPNLDCCEAPQVHSRIRPPAGNDGLMLQDNNYGHDSYIVSAKSLKRASPFCSSQVEARPSKVRAIQKRTEHRRVISRSLSPLLKKVLVKMQMLILVMQNPFVAVEMKKKNAVFLVQRKRTRHQEFIGPKLEACLPCFQRSKDDAGVCTLHLAQRMGNFCIQIATCITIYGRQVVSL